MLSKNTALIIIDVQKGFDDERWGRRNNQENIERLLNRWRETDRPVIHIQHISKKPGHPLRNENIGSEFKEFIEPLDHEPVFQKHVNSAFIGTNLEHYLRENDYQTVVIVGLTTDQCVSTTTRMAGNLGFKIYVVSDATATFERTGYNGKYYSAEDIHEFALVSLHEMFATVVQTEDLLVHI
ncbi:cysteine hydrolase family protein [Sporolactobacillus laevolacticus]|uniref:Isochorismatase n=1 Tax=Sporolactobacillus laevolacticus DSM 442 TaxID=1395513 RepID=V6ITR3_9BACL|nr:cysteine hydrolase family protein [Sporolactobacillus laevolacticus]EST10233.1 isochorismatase [Sporolactobacillus laevolacticus DSM 442]